MKNLKFEIEHHSRFDALIEALASRFVNPETNNPFADVKLYAAIYCPDLVVGQGGNHIWFKNRHDIKTRLAILYLTS